MQSRILKRAGSRLKKRHLVLAALPVLCLVAVFMDKGLLDVYRLNKELGNITDYNDSLKKENAGLEREIELLKTDKRHIAVIARKELGMVGKDEIVYRFVEDRSKAPGNF